MTVETLGKICNRCGIDKPLAEYYQDRKRPDGLRPYCKDCRRVALASRKQNGREANKRRTAARREQINAVKLTLSCVDCGWSPKVNGECWRLHFDHVDPATKSIPGGPAFRPGWTWDRIIAEIALCVPRCSSCHGYRTARQRLGLDQFSVPWSRDHATRPLHIVVDGKTRISVPTLDLSPHTPLTQTP